MRNPFKIDYEDKPHWYTFGCGHDKYSRWIKLGPVSFSLWEIDGRDYLSVRVLNLWAWHIKIDG